MKISSPVLGPQIFLYHDGLSVEATYGLPNSGSARIELKRSFSANLSIRWGHLKNKRAMAGKEFYFPLVIGVGYIYAIEKNEVEGYSGSGQIKGLYYYLGMQMLLSKRFPRIGGHLYFGYNQWKYDDSILVKSGAPLKYNYSKFYGSLALCYFLK
ncbi:hypothetical protein L0337_14845 [candidate division KSB1 bacterium]|nr:hypothetical protein [candidate division KSB1 bacterium]